MIPSNLRTALIIVIVCYFIIILFFLKKKAIELKYTLLWILSGVVMGIMIIWPQTLIFIKNCLGITGNMNALFILSIGFIIIIVMSITSIVSKQSDKIKNLSQEIGLLEKEIRDMESKLKDGDEIKNAI